MDTSRLASWFRGSVPAPADQLTEAIRPEPIGDPLLRTAVAAAVRTAARPVDPRPEWRPER